MGGIWGRVKRSLNAVSEGYRAVRKFTLRFVTPVGGMVLLGFLLYSIVDAWVNYQPLSEARVVRKSGQVAEAWIHSELAVNRHLDKHVHQGKLRLEGDGITYSLSERTTEDVVGVEHFKKAVHPGMTVALKVDREDLESVGEPKLVGNDEVSIHALALPGSGEVLLSLAKSAELKRRDATVIAPSLLAGLVALVVLIAALVVADTFRRRKADRKEGEEGPTG
ncbi:MAG TPA: hypothetical protein VKA48_05920 [Gammaproteobacteria bacterium]|nr:hypothetical protein [Gammaproteobacteria bacterium]